MSETCLALSVRQPHDYLAGCLLGDAWLTQVFGLRSKDEEFAVVVADALHRAFGVTVRPRLDERGYWLVAIGARTGRFDSLRDWEPSSRDAQCAWLRGLFDSEGNVNLFFRPEKGPRSYSRRVLFCSTTIPTLERAQEYLSVLGIGSRLGPWNCGPGHKGTRTVYGLTISSSHHNYRVFCEQVGSSIGRKQRTLEMLVSTYLDPAIYHREAQAKGVQARLARQAERGWY